jgi:uncharacterized protein (DUF362 family)/Pyruvate/2-oxoacid:ferredoxin oxidoreductase delta subunit
MAKGSSYEYGRLRQDVFEMLESLDGGLISRGTRVLIKPNLLTSARPEQAVTTHPLLIRAAAEYAISRGAEVQVSDSATLTSFEKKAKDCGVVDALRGMPVVLRELRASRAVSGEGKFRRLELAEDALDADVIINLPKLKSHSQMVLTLAVKNLFGCVAGMKKPEWHYRVGENQSLFAELLVTIYRALRPSINIIDGILAMEGDGPGTGGTPRRLGVLAGSDDALALDIALCRMLGMEPMDLPTNRAAAEMGVETGMDWEVEGELPAVRDFVLPATSDLLFGPRLSHGFVRRHLTSRPSTDDELCRLCGECEKVCPARAVKRRGRHLRFDYEKCIRCYCCLEVCPHGAMKKEVPLLRRAINVFAGRGAGQGGR